MDESYQDYINRVARLTLPATCSLQLETIQQSPKFVEGKATSFPGYSIITPPGQEDGANESFYRQIEILQQQLSLSLESNLFVPLPPDSFHVTIADLIWENNYLQAVAENADFESQLRKQVEFSFQQYKDSTSVKTSSQWQLWGVAIRPRAIMACLVPKDRDSYQQIIDLRSSLYQNSGLIGLGIEQQYDFTAHVTLGYFDKIPTSFNRSQLCIILSQMNDRLLDKIEPSIFDIKRIELRKFDTMIDYYRESDWAAVTMNGKP
ncbi:DUF1868 domain-containing protein [Myxosarcina sp. GI1]|uniref:DUF1868 domain-containing protein n=1 Tax=Myxosarcina sp. GI1 TaxID=1541065 RepID=UPI00056C34DA|nr:DUF1868 domain-containing protein [Myxosarcina sp. GI1]